MTDYVNLSSRLASRRLPVAFRQPARNRHVEATASRRASPMLCPGGGAPDPTQQKWGCHGQRNLISVDVAPPCGPRVRGRTSPPGGGVGIYYPLGLLPPPAVDGHSARASELALDAAPGWQGRSRSQWQHDFILHSGALKRLHDNSGRQSWLPWWAASSCWAARLGRSRLALHL